VPENTTGSGFDGRYWLVEAMHPLASETVIVYVPPDNPSSMPEEVVKVIVPSLQV
jgi:hypothetical protein